MIKAVIFDIDGVLIDSFEANFKFYQDLMAKTNYPLPSRKDFPKYFHLSLMDAIRVFTKSKDEKEIKRIWNIGRERKVKYDLNLLRYADNLPEVIEELSRKYLLGIVTNRQKEAVFEAPELEKLKKHFKVVICYQDTINHKPHPEPLFLAAKKLKVKPEECVYVGDVENDIKAGKAAGMKVIIYSKEQFVTADICTTSFEKLPEIIESL
jgi:HAD superfamily hydrolase (TIGR01662 family)